MDRVVLCDAGFVTFGGGGFVSNTIQQFAERILELSEKATGGTWFAKADGWTIRAHVGGPGFDDGIKIATTYGRFIPSKGREPSIEQQVANQELIAEYRTFAPAIAAAYLKLLDQYEDALKTITVVSDMHDKASLRIDDLLASLKEALRYVEVKIAYQGAMTAEQVEAAIKENRQIGRVEVGANSCKTLAEFDLDKARALVKPCESRYDSVYEQGQRWLNTL